MTHLERFFTIKEFAAKVGANEEEVQNAIEDRQLNAYLILGELLIERKEVKRWKK